MCLALQMAGSPCGAGHLPGVWATPIPELLLAASNRPVGVDRELARDTATRARLENQPQPYGFVDAHEMTKHDIEEPLVGDRRITPLVQVLLERSELDDFLAWVERHVQSPEVWLITSSEERHLRRLVLQFHGAARVWERSEQVWVDVVVMPSGHSGTVLTERHRRQGHWLPADPRLRHHPS